MKMKGTTVLAGVASIMLWNCAYGDSHETCADFDSLELKVKKSHLVLKDKTDEDFPACVALGGTFAIKVKATGGADIQEGDVHANAVAGSPITISGHNEDDADLLVIEVTGDSPPNGEVKYEIHVDGIGMLDPRVRVIDVEELRRIQIGVLKETIDNWHIGVDVIEETIKELQSGY